MKTRFKIKMKSSYSSGQALLAVVLVLVVALTVGLSAATRNITNVRLTSDEQASQRALSAAEAGVEQAIKVPAQRGIIIGAGGATPTRGIGDANIEKVNVQALNGTELLLNGGNIIPRNQPVDVWLSTYGTYANPWSGFLYIYWYDKSDICADATASQHAALLITSFSVPPSPIAATDLSRVVIRNFPVDPCATRRASNNFCPNNAALDRCLKSNGTDNGSVRYVTSTQQISGVTFRYRFSVAFGPGGATGADAPQAGLLLRITPLYADTKIGIIGKDVTDTVRQALPEQGTLIESTGSSGSTQRKVSVYRSNPMVPPELFYTIFSP